MITVEPVTLRNVLLFKAVRLRALRDTPLAFGSTYEKEIQLTDADWNERVMRWNGENGVGFLAMEAVDACGIAGSFLDPEDRARAHLVSMWTAPTHRRRGVGRLLVEEVAGWASQRGARTLRLLVTSHNQPAILFYERLGFAQTGRFEPYPNDPALSECEMLRTLP